MDISSITSPDDAAAFLDANVARQSNWYSGFGTNKFCRIPEFSRFFKDVSASWTGSITVEQHFLALASSVARDLRDSGRPQWCKGDFSRPQFDAAMDGAPMRFDKAVMVVLALNKFAGELGLEQPFGTHCLVACGFRFDRMHELIGQASAEYAAKASNAQSLTDEQCRQAVLRYLADVARQPFNVVRDLAKADGRVKFTASYPTQRAIYKALMAFPACEAVVGTVERADLIQLRKRGESQMSAVEGEKLAPAEAVTRPPYHWQDKETLEGGKHAFPPEIVPPNPFDTVGAA